jgi:hypothetical protein
MWTDFYFTNLPKWAFFWGGRPIKRGPPKKEKEKKNFGLCPRRLIRGNHTNTNVHNTSHWMNQYLSGPIVAIQCAILFNIIIIIWKHSNSRPDLTSHWHPQVKFIEQRADRSFTCTPLGLILGPYLWSQVPRRGVTPVSHACPMPRGPSPLGSKCHFEWHLFWVTFEWLELV